VGRGLVLGGSSLGRSAVPATARVGRLRPQHLSIVLRERRSTHSPAYHLKNLLSWPTFSPSPSPAPASSRPPLQACTQRRAPQHRLRLAPLRCANLTRLHHAASKAALLAPVPACTQRLSPNISPVWPRFQHKSRTPPSRRLQQQARTARACVPPMAPSMRLALSLGLLLALLGTAAGLCRPGPSKKPSNCGGTCPPANARSLSCGYSAGGLDFRNVWDTCLANKLSCCTCIALRLLYLHNSHVNNYVDKSKDWPYTAGLFGSSRTTGRSATAAALSLLRGRQL